MPAQPDSNLKSQTSQGRGTDRTTRETDGRTAIAGDVTMRWDYGRKMERVLTAKEDFEEGIGRFLDDENGEPGEFPT